MRALYVALPLVLALGACQTIGGTPTAGLTTQQKIVLAKTQADTSVAQAAQTLHDNCALLETGLAVGSTFLKGKKVIAAAAKAQVALDSFCAGPVPADIPGALAAVSKAYRDVLAAKQAATTATGA